MSRAPALKGRTPSPRRPPPTGAAAAEGIEQEDQRHDEGHVRGALPQGFERAEARGVEVEERHQSGHDRHDGRGDAGEPAVIVLRLDRAKEALHLLRRRGALHLSAPSAAESPRPRTRPPGPPRALRRRRRPWRSWPRGRAPARPPGRRAPPPRY